MGRPWILVSLVVATLAAAAPGFARPSTPGDDLSLLRQLIEELDAVQSEVDQVVALTGSQPAIPADADERLKAAWVRRLRVRQTLVRLVATHLAPLDDRDATPSAPEQRRILLGYGSCLALFCSAARLTAAFERPQSLFWRKLDEADPSFDLPGGLLSRDHRTITRRKNVKLLATARSAYLLAFPTQAREHPDVAWLHRRIALEHAALTQLAPNLWRARLQQLWRAALSSVWRPWYQVQSAVAIWVGDAKWRPRAPSIDEARIGQMTALLQPGDLLLEREDWFLSNLFLGGFWPHGILYVGTVADLERLGLTSDPRVARHLAAYAEPGEGGHPRRVIEALSDGVIMSPMEEACSADYIAAFRPRVSDAARREAIARAFSHVGKPYDFDFDFRTADAIVCTELLWRGYGDALGWPMKTRLGRPSVSGTDLVRKFAAERDTPGRQLDFLFFVDSDRTTRETWFADEASLIQSADRPGFEGLH